MRRRRKGERGEGGEGGPRLGMAKSCPLGIFPIVHDVMNSHLRRKLRVAKPEAGATFSLYANGRGMTQWSISMPVVCFCHLSQMDMELPSASHPPPPTSAMKEKENNYWWTPAA